MKEYIEREAALEAILGLTIVDPTVAQYANAVYLILQNLPAADIAPVRHGRWIDAESDDGCTVWHCSKCSYPIKTICGYPIYKYCPMCGALMDGEEDNIDGE